MDPDIWVNPGIGQSLLGPGTTYSVNVGKCHLDPLIAGQVNTN
jgi:hypothetical protein